MYISLEWVKDFIKIPAQIKPNEIAEELTRHTVEVERVLRLADLYNKVVVGEVLTVNCHPNADRLRVALVNVKNQKLSIVCGAANLSAGQKVAVALIGSVLPNGAEIKEAEIRGEKSFGMICAEDELGLGKDHEGILILDKEAKIGQNFAQHLKITGLVLEVDNKSLSNRPDLLSHYGIAREIGAIFNIPLRPYNKFLSKKIKFLSKPENKLEVKVENKELCPRYMAVKISGLEIKESPAWLKNRLVAVGQKPINNIVDLTNYVMLERGQPLHAFNAVKLKKIVVRQANKKEGITCLDGKERILTENDLVITTGKEILALAGIIGGSNSEVRTNTTEIVLESANFDATTIRKTSQRLRLRTEASTRFEKSLDPNLPPTAIMRFLTLLEKICPGYNIDSNLVDINNFSPTSKIISLDLIWLTKKIGQEIAVKKVIQYLTSLGFTIQDETAPILQVGVPSWRATRDIIVKEDLVEEILRLYGYDNISSQMPTVAMILPKVNEARLLERKIKNILAFTYSLNESYNYSFLGQDQLKKLNIDFSYHLRLANPLSNVHSFLRQSLIPNLINNVKTNQVNPDKFGFFEIGRIYLDAPGRFYKDNSKEELLPYQGKRLGIVLAGNNENVFTTLKGIINGLFQKLLNHEFEAEFSLLETKPSWSSDISAKIIIDKQEIGLVAMLNQEVNSQLNLKKQIAVAEINFEELVSLVFGQTSLKFQAGFKYPPVIRDLAFVVDKEILYNDLRKEIISFNPLIKSVELFDVYTGNKLEDNQKSLAFHLYYQAEDKTLTMAEVDQVQISLVEHLAQKFTAQLRNF